MLSNFFSENKKDAQKKARDDFFAKLQAIPKALTYEESYLAPGLFAAENSFDGLSECACKNGFDRRKTNLRSEIEQKIIKTISTQYPLEKTSSLNYLSLGAGFLLQDYILIGTLLTLGYSINAYLIEPQKNNQDFQRAWQKFVSLLTPMTKEFDVVLTLKSYANIIECVKEEKKLLFHVIHAIDYASIDIETSLNMIEELVTAYGLLSLQGFLYMICGGFEFQYFRDNKANNTSKISYKDELSLLIESQGKFIPELAEKIDTFEKEIQTVTGIESEYILKTICQYAGLFRQGPLYQQKDMLNQLLTQNKR